MSSKRVLVAAIVVTLVSNLDSLFAWGGQGHRLVGLIAAERLTPAARLQVRTLLDGQTLADVSSWADAITGDQVQTSYWHYVNIPSRENGYDRDRDCPRQPGVAAGSRSDQWRDCVVDRIGYWEGRLADTRLDRPDRATALKFLVHFVGDLHQPFHAIGDDRGGNNVKVRVFGEANCGPSTGSGPPRAQSRGGTDPARPSPCNLHSVWDSRLIAHRALDDVAYVSALNKMISAKRLGSQPVGTPAQWAEQSFRLAKDALVGSDTNIDDAYYRRHIAVIDERIALGGVRLASELNRILR